MGRIRRSGARRMGVRVRVVVSLRVCAAVQRIEKHAGGVQSGDQLRQHEQVVPSFATRVRVPRIVVEKNQASTSGDKVAP